MSFRKWIGDLIQSMFYAITHDPPARNEITFGSSPVEIEESRANVARIQELLALGLREEALAVAREIPVRTDSDQENFRALMRLIGGDVAPKAADPEPPRSGRLMGPVDALVVQGAFLAAVAEARKLRHSLLDYDAIICYIGESAIAAGARTDLQVMFTDPELAAILGPERRIRSAR